MERCWGGRIAHKLDTDLQTTLIKDPLLSSNCFFFFFFFFFFFNFVFRVKKKIEIKMKKERNKRAK